MPQGKPSVHDKLKSVVESHLGDALISDGWSAVPSKRRDSFTSAAWERPAESQDWYVDVQRSKYWKKSGGSFTVNLMVWIPDFERAISAEPISDRPKHLFGSASTRLPKLAFGSDRWWKIGRWTRLQKLGSTVADTWNDHGPNWFARYGTISTVGDWFESEGNNWLAAVARTLAGDLDAARTAYAQHLRLGTSLPPEVITNSFHRAEGIGLVDASFVARAESLLAKGPEAFAHRIDDLFGELPSAPP